VVDVDVVLAVEPVGVFVVVVALVDVVVVVGGFSAFVLLVEGVPALNTHIPLALITVPAAQTGTWQEPLIIV
jgi:hypothetical protein